MDANGDVVSLSLHSSEMEGNTQTPCDDQEAAPMLFTRPTRGRSRLCTYTPSIYLFIYC